MISLFMSERETLGGGYAGYLFVGNDCSVWIACAGCQRGLTVAVCIRLGLVGLGRKDSKSAFLFLQEIVDLLDQLQQLLAVLLNRRLSAERSLVLPCMGSVV
jgi:hypothetical protein